MGSNTVCSSQLFAIKATRGAESSKTLIFCRNLEIFWHPSQISDLHPGEMTNIIERCPILLWNLQYARVLFQYYAKKSHYLKLPNDVPEINFIENWLTFRFFTIWRYRIKIQKGKVHNFPKLNVFILFFRQWERKQIKLWN